MRRPREEEPSDVVEGPSPSLDFARRLEAALRRGETLIVVDRGALASVTEQTTANPAEDLAALRRCDFFVFFRSDVVSHDATHRAPRVGCLEGCGVACSSATRMPSGAGGGVRVELLFVALKLVPWSLTLPTPLSATQLHYGGVATLDSELEHVGVTVPVPSGVAGRTPVTLLAGMPRCIVHAVAARFPVLRRMADDDGDEQWTLAGDSVCTEAQRREAAEHHLRVLQAYRDAGSAALAALLGDTADAALEWAIVSYPNVAPLPVASVSSAEVDGDVAAAAAAPCCVLPVQWLLQTARLSAHPHRSHNTAHQLDPAHVRTRDAVTDAALRLAETSPVSVELVAWRRSAKQLRATACTLCTAAEL